MASNSRRPWHSKFDLGALLDHASRLGNSRCTCNKDVQPNRGSLNWAIFLSFEDGKEWVFRSPTTDGNGVSLETAGALLESEVATMKYIKLHSTIPIPHIFDYSSTKFNPIGIPFILMSKASGIPLRDLNWDPSSRRDKTLPVNQGSYLTTTKKEKVMQQLGAVASQLLNLRFNKIGSLFIEGADYYIGTCLSPAFIYQDRDNFGDRIPRGPFEHDDEYYEALLSAFYLQVREYTLQQNVFFAPTPQAHESAARRWDDFVAVGAKIDSARNRLDYCTVGHFLRSMIPSIEGEWFAALVNSEDKFPICHPDLSTSNIFVDDDLNITCIIDWACASTVPISTLLMTPGLPHPRDDTDFVLDTAFKSGFIDHHFHRNGMNLTPDVWEHTRMAWLFTRLVVLDGSSDYFYFKELYSSVYKPKEEVSLSTLFKNAQKEEEDVVEIAEVLAEDDDEDHSSQVSKEEYYFAEIGRIEGQDENEAKLSGMERHAIARKITMVSELSQNFVADKRLWRWIEKMMQEGTSPLSV